MGLCLAVGISGSGLTINAVHHWYLTLARPALCPPSWLFAPVWTVLYLMMGVAAWLVWREPDLDGRNRRALIAWGWQLGINALWAPVFFGLHLILLGLVVNVALFGAIGWTLLSFLPARFYAALLMVPYLAWAGFASYLNAGFWWLNH